MLSILVPSRRICNIREQNYSLGLCASEYMQSDSRKGQTGGLQGRESFAGEHSAELGLGGAWSLGLQKCRKRAPNTTGTQCGPQSQCAGEKLSLDQEDPGPSLAGLTQEGITCFPFFLFTHIPLDRTQECWSSHRRTSPNTASHAIGFEARPPGFKSHPAAS